MKPMKSFFKNHGFIFLLCSAFLIVTVALAATWFSTQLNPDATAYISIAQKYARGDIAHAINGYWGPMLSILMVPFLWLHIDPIIAAKTVSALAGTGILILAYWFLRQRQVSRTITYFTCASLAALIMGWVTYDPITPDVIYGFLLAMIGIQLVAYLQRPTLLKGAVIGGLGALLYLTKGFGLYLFIATIGALAIWHWWQNGKKLRPVVERFGLMLVVFAVLVLPFITVLTIKYKQITINNAGTFDYRAFGVHGMSEGNFPPVTMRDQKPLQPMPPSNATAVNAWEDPSLLIPLLRNWSPLESWSHFVFYLTNIISANLVTMANYVYGNGPLVMLGFGALAIGWAQRSRWRREFVIFGLIGVLTIGGYSLIFAEGRYLPGVIILGVLSFALWVGAMQRARVFRQMHLLLAGTFILVLTLVCTGSGIVQHKHEESEWRDVSMAIKDYIPAQAHVVADTFDPFYYSCYYLDLRCYNVIKPNADFPGYYKLLKSFDIKYYIDYHHNDTDPLLQQFIAAYFTQRFDGYVNGVRVTVYALI